MTDAFGVDPADVWSGERDRFERATPRFSGHRVCDPASPVFDEAFGALWDCFGAQGELERRPVLEAWLREPTVRGPLRIDYHLLVWRERASGALVAIRDAFVGVDRAGGSCVALLSHALVLPGFRRSGVAAVVRTAPATLARQAVAAAGIDAPRVLVAEMEPVDPADAASIVRLLAYGRAGFAVVPPAVLPYCQPDFRALSDPSDAAPIPMALVVRVVGRESARALPAPLASAIVAQLAAIHERACEPTHVRALAEADHAALLHHGGASIPLLALPTAPAQLERLTPLLRSRMLAHYPARFRRDVPDPVADLAALRAMTS